MVVLLYHYRARLMAGFMHLSFFVITFIMFTNIILPYFFL